MPDALEEAGAEHLGGLDVVRGMACSPAKRMIIMNVGRAPDLGHGDDDHELRTSMVGSSQMNGCSMTPTPSRIVFR